MISHGISDPYLEIAAIEAEIQRRVWLEHPELWIRDRLGEVTWSKQREVLVSVVRNRRTAVRSCHEVGKSWLAGRIASWWLDAHPPGTAFVVTTAPTNPQIKAILWREIGRAFTKGKLAGRVNQSEWYMSVNGKEEIVGFGRKPDDYDPAAFQGIHAIYVLVIVDEANGVRGPLHEAAESLIANDESKIVMIGNPDDPAGEFYDACKPGSGWNVVGISAFDSPNFTGEPLPDEVLKQLVGRLYVEEKRRKWAKTWFWVDKDGKETTAELGVKCVMPDGGKMEDTAPTWQSKILGLFPENSAEGGLIPIGWVKAAQLRSLEPGIPVELGVDVGGGGDATSVCVRRGDVYRIRRTDNDPDTMKQCGKIVDDITITGASCAKIDKIGIGWGIVNRGKELRKPFIGVNVGEGASEDNSAADERFANLKAELWWHVRCLFEAGRIDIDSEDDDLAAELCQIRYERVSSGKIKISNKKKDEKGVTIASPNRAESLMLAAAPPRLVPVVTELEISWG